ncbi:testis-specific gene 10 protein-like [Symsagittifera roscoffensis]|uniref:testis-specific gene 10 protein-like n=1 Tax=Symsagittifera roscoffensis TaxID=84072 RepID=UPI00307BD5BE
MEPVWNVFNGLTSRVEGLFSENQLLRKRNQTLETQLLHSLNNERISCEIKEKLVVELQRKLEDKDLEYSNLKVEMDKEKISMSSEKKLLENQRAALEEELEMFKKKLHKSDLKILELQNYNNNLKAEQNQLNIQRNDLAMEIENINKMFQKIQDVKKLNANTLLTIEANMNELVDCNRKLSATAKTSEQERSKLVSELKKFEQLISSLDVTKKTLEKELIEVKSSSDHEKKELRCSIENLEGKLSATQTELETVNQENDALETQLLRTFDEIRNIKLKMFNREVKESRLKNVEDEVKEEFSKDTESSESIKVAKENPEESKRISVPNQSQAMDVI